MGTGKGQTKRVNSVVDNLNQLKGNNKRVIVDPNAWIKYCFNNEIANERIAEYYFGKENAPVFIRDQEQASFALYVV